MGHQVEHAGHRGAAAHGQHHVAQLAHGAVGQTLLEVLLGEGDRGPQEQGDRADHGDRELHGWKGLVHRLQSGHQEHPGRHHRGRMNQGRDRRGALHGVGQPHVQGELGRLGHRAHEHQQAEDHGHAVAEAAACHRFLQAGTDLLKAEAAGGPEQAENAQQQAEVPHPIGHEGLLGGVGGAVAVIPEAHQQVGAHAHQLPEHIDLEQVGADHQAQHRAAEQGQVGEKAHVALVVGHVAVGVHHHQHRDGGHQRQHHRRQGIHPEAHLQVERAGTGPVEQHLGGAGASQLLGQDRVAEYGGCPHTADQQPSHGFAQPVDRAVETDQAQAHQAGPGQGQHWDQPGEFGG